MLSLIPAAGAAAYRESGRLPPRRFKTGGCVAASRCGRPLKRPGAWRRKSINRGCFRSDRRGKRAQRASRRYRLDRGRRQCFGGTLVRYESTRKVTIWQFRNPARASSSHACWRQGCCCRCTRSAWLRRPAPWASPRPTHNAAVAGVVVVATAGAGVRQYRHGDCDRRWRGRDRRRDRRERSPGATAGSHQLLHAALPVVRSPEHDLSGFRRLPPPVSVTDDCLRQTSEPRPRAGVFVVGRRDQVTLRSMGANAAAVPPASPRSNWCCCRGCWNRASRGAACPSPRCCGSACRSDRRRANRSGRSARRPDSPACPR